tara:strand:+ start:203 stop:679 length:477 start_codon:yes stop_codon:yes gene_type:complete
MQPPLKRTCGGLADSADSLQSRFFAHPCRCKNDARSLLALCIEASGQALEALGPAHSEKSYEEVLCNKLYDARIPVRRQVTMSQVVDQHVVFTGVADLEVDHRVILELKANHASISAEHRAQLRRYLRAASASLKTDDVMLGAIILFTKDGTLETWQA